MNNKNQNNYLERLETLFSSLHQADNCSESTRILIKTLEALIYDKEAVSNSNNALERSINIVVNSALWMTLNGLERQKEQSMMAATERSVQQVHRQLLENNRVLRERSMLDDLTGLYNRRYFERSLSYDIERSKRYGRSIGIILFDLDYFKKVNDTYGHAIGDQALKHLANTAKSCIRSADILARYGGEEFTLLLPETDMDGARTTAERLRKKIASSPLNAEEQEVQMTVSCGVTAIAPPFEGDLDDVMRAADTGLYEAKKQGRNRVITTQLALD